MPGSGSPGQGDEGRAVAGIGAALRASLFASSSPEPRLTRAESDQTAERPRGSQHLLARVAPAASGAPLGVEDGTGDGATSNSGSENLNSVYTRNISAPLLGSFPFSLWDLVQIPSAPETSMASSASSTRTSVSTTSQWTRGWRQARRAGAASARSTEGRGTGGEGARHQPVGESADTSIQRGEDRFNAASCGATSSTAGVPGGSPGSGVPSESSGGTGAVAARARPSPSPPTSLSATAASGGSGTWDGTPRRDRRHLRRRDSRSATSCANRVPGDPDNEAVRSSSCSTTGHFSDSGHLDPGNGGAHGRRGEYVPRQASQPLHGTAGPVALHPGVLAGSNPGHRGLQDSESLSGDHGSGDRGSGDHDSGDHGSGDRRRGPERAERGNNRSIVNDDQEPDAAQRLPFRTMSSR